MKYENRHYRRRTDWWHLTRRFTALGREVAVANSRGPETLADLAAETGAKPVSVEEAARFGEVVIVTIPEKNIPNLPRDLFAAVARPPRSTCLMCDWALCLLDRPFQLTYNLKTSTPISARFKPFTLALFRSQVHCLCLELER